MRMYFGFVGILASIIAVYGFIMPYFICAASDWQVILGVGIGMAYAPLVVLWGKKIVTKENNNEVK